MDQRQITRVIKIENHKFYKFYLRSTFFFQTILYLYSYVNYENY